MKLTILNFFRVQIVPRSPTSLKGGESSSSGSQCDPGYDSYSLSSTDSLPLQQTLKHNLQVCIPLIVN